MTPNYHQSATLAHSRRDDLLRDVEFARQRRQICLAPAEPGKVLQRVRTYFATIVGDRVTARPVPAPVTVEGQPCA